MSTRRNRDSDYDSDCSACSGCSCCDKYKKKDSHKRCKSKKCDKCDKYDKPDKHKKCDKPKKYKCHENECDKNIEVKSDSNCITITIKHC